MFIYFRYKSYIGAIKIYLFFTLLNVYLNYLNLIAYMGCDEI
jgi:hypothetical protein